MSATTQSIATSNQKEQEVKLVSEINIPSVAPPSLTPVPAEKQYVILRAVNKKKKRFRVDGRCDNVWNEQTKQYERIYNVRGWSSIWASDLVEQLKDKDYLGKNLLSLVFVNGVCRLPIKEVRQIEFARKNINNVGKERNTNGKWDFYEYDVNEEAKERLAKENKKIQTIITVGAITDESKIKKLASWFKISFTDEIGMPKGTDSLKMELLLMANTNPELVNKYLDSTEVDVAYMVREAILDAKIDLTGQNGSAIWAGGKGFIARIPTGRTAYEYLTALALEPTPEGTTFREQLKNVVK